MYNDDSQQKYYLKLLEISKQAKRQKYQGENGNRYVVSKSIKFKLSAPRIHFGEDYCYAKTNLYCIKDYY